MLFGNETPSGPSLATRRAARSGRPLAAAPAKPTETRNTDDHHAIVVGQPLTGPTDPRWVLAVRTSELLEGPILGPEHRERLIKLGTTLGLSLFDANLVIAIVQDQARRGYAPRYCPTAGEGQLQMIPLTPAARLGASYRARRPLYLACGIAVILALELLILNWAMG